MVLARTKQAEKVSKQTNKKILKKMNLPVNGWKDFTLVNNGYFIFGCLPTTKTRTFYLKQQTEGKFSGHRVTRIASEFHLVCT
jgi:hypothetical protein